MKPVQFILWYLKAENKKTVISENNILFKCKLKQTADTWSKAKPVKTTVTEFYWFLIYH